GRARRRRLGGPGRREGVVIQVRIGRRIAAAEIVHGDVGLCAHCMPASRAASAAARGLRHEGRHGAKWRGACKSYIRYKTLAPIPLLPLQSRPTTLLATRLYAGLPCWKRIANTSPSAPRWVSPRCPSPPNKPPI